MHKIDSVEYKLVLDIHAAKEANYSSDK